MKELHGGAFTPEGAKSMLSAVQPGRVTNVEWLQAEVERLTALLDVARKVNFDQDEEIDRLSGMVGRLEAREKKLRAITGEMRDEELPVDGPKLVAEFILESGYTVALDEWERRAGKVT